MANWKYVIPIHDLLELGEENPPEFGKKLADRIEETIPPHNINHDAQLRQILEDLRDEDCVVDKEETNLVLERLYDWGDNWHRLYLNVFPPITPPAKSQTPTN